MTERAHRSAVFLLCATAVLFAWEISAQPAPPPPPVPSDAQAPASVLAPSGSKPAAGTTDCDRCGTVEVIRQAAAQGQVTPLGSVPSVASGSTDLNPASTVTAFKIGKDLSNQGQVMIGAAGGAVYQQGRPGQRNVTRWEIVVRMGDGSARSVIQNYEPLLQVGDRVRVFGTQVELVQ
jgi:outer membrane lipoprotein SlyB